MNLSKQFLGPNAADGSKIRLANNQALRARNAADSGDVNLIRLNTTDQLMFGDVASPGWQKFEYTYAQFSDPGTTKTVTILNIPTGHIVESIGAYCSTGFVGGAISEVTLSIDDTSPTQYTGFTVFNAPNQAFGNFSNVYFDSAKDLTITLTSTDDNLDQLTQGVVEVYVKLKNVNADAEIGAPGTSNGCKVFPPDLTMSGLTQMLFNSPDREFDQGNYIQSANTFTLSAAGIFLIAASGSTGSEGVFDDVQIGYKVNGGPFRRLADAFNTNTGTSNLKLNGMTVEYLGSGDQITFWAQSSIDTTLVELEASVVALIGGFGLAEGSTVVTGAALDLSNLTATAINTSLLPNANGAYTLGQSGLEWGSAWITNMFSAGQMTIQSASNLVRLTASGQDMDWNGSSLVVNGGINASGGAISGASLSASAGVSGATVTGTTLVTSGGVPFGPGPGSTGTGTLAIGQNALDNSNTGNYNIAIGMNALTANSSGPHNIAIGESAMGQMQTGQRNLAIGSESLALSTAGEYNTAIGFIGLNAATGNYNTVLGSQAGYQLAAGDSNLFVGAFAGGALTSGSGNVIIGSNDGSSISGQSNTILISDGAGTIKLKVNSSGHVVPGGHFTQNFGISGTSWLHVFADQIDTNRITFMSSGALATTGANPLTITTDAANGSDSGLFSVTTGNTGPTSSNSGAINLTTGNVNTAYNNTSGAINLTTGNGGLGSNTRNSGDINLVVGTPSSGGTRGKVVLSGLYIDAGSSQIRSLADPSSAQHAATKNYVDTYAFTWHKFSATYADIAAAPIGTATNKFFQVFSDFNSWYVKDVIIKHSASFTGGAISAYTVGVTYDTANSSTPLYDVFQSPASNRWQNTPLDSFQTGSRTLWISGTSTGANLSAATAGSVDVWVLMSRLP